MRPKEDRAQLFWEAFDSSNPAHLAHLIALYDGGVFFADHIFGDIVELLKERDLFEKTIFVLLSDHGEEFYEHGNRGHLHLYVQELHVPLMVRFPGGEMAGRRVRETARTVDVFPTVLDLLGIDSGEIQGISMLPFLRKGAPYRPDIVSFSVIKPGGTVRVEEKGFSYSNEAPERLYDLASDPRESDNIVSRDPRERERLRSTAEERQRAKAAFIDRMGSPAESSPAEMTPEVEKEMRALGYL
ncbi:MAG TPA: sulfatase-like hydrolase/transferase [bacterium]|nr:sulfatase-like hydrolase/transferase [bacterium]